MDILYCMYLFYLSDLNEVQDGVLAPLGLKMYRNISRSIPTLVDNGDD